MPTKRQRARAKRRQIYDESKTQETDVQRQERLDRLRASYHSQRANVSQEKLDEVRSADRLRKRKLRENELLEIRKQRREMSLDSARKRLANEEPAVKSQRQKNAYRNAIRRLHGEPRVNTVKRLAKARSRSADFYVGLSPPRKRAVIAKISSSNIIRRTNASLQTSSTFASANSIGATASQSNSPRQSARSVRSLLTSPSFPKIHSLPAGTSRGPGRTRKKRPQRQPLGTQSTTNTQSDSLPPFHYSEHIQAFNDKISNIPFNQCNICREQYPGLQLQSGTTTCRRCANESKDGVHKFSAENNMDPGEISDDLRPYMNMTPVEQMLIAQVLPLMSVYRLPFGQYAYTGHIINLPQNVQNFITTLPRKLTAADVIVVRRLGSGDTHKDFKVRRHMILGALQKLKEHSVYYRDIVIDSNELERLPVDGTYEMPACDVDIDGTTSSQSTQLSHCSQHSLSSVTTSQLLFGIRTPPSFKLLFQKSNAQSQPTPRYSPSPSHLAPRAKSVQSQFATPPQYSTIGQYCRENASMLTRSYSGSPFSGFRSGSPFSGFSPSECFGALFAQHSFLRHPSPLQRLFSQRSAVTSGAVGSNIGEESRTTKNSGTAKDECDMTFDTAFVPIAIDRKAEKDIIADRFADIANEKQQLPQNRSRKQNRRQQSSNRQRPTTQPQHSEPILWPELDTNNPIDEFNQEGYVARAFPILFFTGKADFNAPREKSVTPAEYYGHLMHYFDGRFATHPTFRYFAFNTILRWRALSCGRVFVKQNPGDARLTDEELKQMSDSEKKSLLNKMTHYGGTLRGTPMFFKARRRELTCFIDQIGMPSQFFTLSAADSHWPELSQLLPTDLPRRKAIVQHPGIVNWFCQYRMRTFVELILRKHFPGKDFWYRIEWQDRGGLHVHGVLIMDGAPDVDALKHSSDNDADTIEFFERYCHATNPSFDADGNERQAPIGQTVNPSSVRLDDICDFDSDYAALIRSCQRHTRCTEEHCLRKQKGCDTAKCRYGFPKDICQMSEIVRNSEVESTERGATIEIKIKRNDPLINLHNRTLLQVHRANIDFQPVVDKNQLIEYVVKYATKAEKRSKWFIDVFKTLVNDMGELDDVRKLTQRMLLKTVGERDYCAQETCHHLDQLPLTRCSRTFVHLNVSGDREVQRNENGIVMPNAIDKYMARPTSEHFENLSFFEFWQQYYLAKGKPQAYRNKPVIVIHPYIPDVEDSPRREEFCKTYLTTHKPFRVVADLKKGFNSYTDAYIAFTGGNRNRTFEDATRAAQANAENNDVSEENNGDHDEAELRRQRDVDDWMLICRQHPEFNDTQAGDAYDWLEASKGYDVDQMKCFITWAKDQPIQTTAADDGFPDADQLNAEQRRVYDLVVEYVNDLECGNEVEALRLVVSGTAGTGKSFVIKLLKHLLKDRCRVLAPTGAAAHNVGGETIHSFFRLPISRGSDLRDLTGDVLAEMQNKNNNVVLLIIDEMSMIGKRLMGVVDVRLRQYFPLNATEVMGGVGVLLLGDFGQLPPVGDPPLFSTEGKSKYADAGGAVYKQFSKAVILQQVERQAKDARFKDLLIRVRNGQTTKRDYELLSTRFDGHVSASDRARFDSAIRIFTRVEKAAAYNLHKLQSMSRTSPIAKLEAKHTGGKRASSANTDDAGGIAKVVFLCKGARVMLTSNLWVEQGLCNGATGTVVDIVYTKDGPPTLPEFVVVKFDRYSGPSCRDDIAGCIPITPVRRYWTSDTTLCTRENVPLQLSWAITVHKSQGLTLPNAVIDLSGTEFCAGLTFVALSRVSCLEDLLLVPFARERLQKLGKGRRFVERYAEDIRLLRMSGSIASSAAHARSFQRAEFAAAPAADVAPVQADAIDEVQFMRLTNDSSWCYSNALVQCLLGSTNFVNSLHADESACATALLQLLAAKHDSARFGTRVLREVLDAALSTIRYTAPEQRDALSFLEDMLDCLPWQCQQLFQIRKTCHSRCDVCDNVVTATTFPGMVDEVYLGNNIQSVNLETVVNETEVVRGQCPHCREAQDLTNSVEYSVLPNTGCLIISLPIFRGAMVRYDYSIDTFDCENFVFGNATWKLVGAVIHYGASIASGHYVSWVRGGTGWLKISDEVLQVNSESLGSLSGCQLLLFERRL